MTTISIYDEEAKTIDKISEDFNTTSAEIIAALFTALNEEEIDISDYL